MDKKELRLGRSLFINSRQEDIHKFYDFVKELGSGGYGTVYEATMRRNPQIRRAIKSVKKETMLCRESLKNQVQILILLDHPNIIKIFETFEDDQFFHIVMDICTGNEFFYYLIEKGSITEREARHFFKQMVIAVQYCHAQKVAHRDIKPENFLLASSSSKNLKLIDFGLAFKWKADMSKEVKIMKMIGTAYYVSPQIIGGKSYDQRCDIWALGVILYIMVTATPPFNGNNDREILKAVKRGAYNLCGTELTGLSSELQDLISKILTPADERISLAQIMSHPWMKKEVPQEEHKLNYGKIFSYANSNKMKKIAINCIASQLSEQAIMRLGQLFRESDVDGDGVISYSEFKQSMLKQKRLISQKERQHLIDAIDIDRDGVINYTEFVTSCLENSIIFKKENILNAFQLLDKDQDGIVTSAELKATLQKLNTNIQGKEIQEILKASDKNGDGHLDIEEFTKTLASW